MKRKTQELTLVFGSTNSGKSDNIIDILEEKNPEDKVYIIDYAGKYKELLSKKQIDFNYHTLKETTICAPLPFESYIEGLNGEEYTNEFYAHLEENVKIISEAAFCPLSEVTVRKTLTKMYENAGITAKKYSPVPQVEKALSREAFYELLEKIDPEGGNLLFETVQRFKADRNYTENLMNFTVPNDSFKTDKDIVLLELDNYQHGEDVLVDLKVESLFLRVCRRIRNEGKPLILVIDNLYPFGQKNARMFNNVTDYMKVYYLNNRFEEFRNTNEEIFFIAEEIRFHRCDEELAETLSKYFSDPSMVERLIAQSSKNYLSVRPGEDITRSGDYLFLKNNKQVCDWQLEWIENT